MHVIGHLFLYVHRERFVQLSPLVSRGEGLLPKIGLYGESLAATGGVFTSFAT